jgi:hypothetical protein
MVTAPRVVVVVAAGAEDVVTSLEATVVELADSDGLSSDPQLTPATARAATTAAVRGRGRRMIPSMLRTKRPPAGSPPNRPVKGTNCPDVRRP